MLLITLRGVPTVAAGEVKASVYTGNGRVVWLLQSTYESMRYAFRAGTKSLKSAAGFSLFDTCYDLSGFTTVKVPTLVFHFDRGAHLSVPANNYLIPVDSSGVLCFVFAGTTGGLSIIGNIQQQGFRVAFDMQSNRVGFAAGSCS
ncbi:aspartyl protease family protein 2-like [Cryptomeria japonica]|uniref:aspartyl protease family protein 2-like n=1 Tax=Cryptomeria japonica TaxID=3369 RepID=UPI0027DA79BD|nr:aspartyl protease family protein 2-like [Cryptomeria japonica]